MSIKKNYAEDEIPPEVYHAYFLLTMKWLGMEENEHLEFVKKATKRGARQQARWNGTFLPPYFDRGNSTLFGFEFDEYLSEAWIDFLDKFQISDKYKTDDLTGLTKNEIYEEPIINKFIEYLEEEHRSSANDYEKKLKDMEQKFENETFEELDSLIEKYADLSDDEFEKLTDELLNRKLGELQKERERVQEKEHGPYIPLEFILMNAIRNKVERESYWSKKGFSIDPLDDGSETPLLSRLEDQGAGVEEKTLTKDIVQSAIKELDDINKKIVDLISQGYKQKDIAKELGISDAAVSKRMKKIREVIAAKSNIK